MHVYEDGVVVMRLRCWVMEWTKPCAKAKIEGWLLVAVCVKFPSSLTNLAQNQKLIKPKMVWKHHVGYLFFTIYFVPFVCICVCIFILLPLLFGSLTCTLFGIGKLLNNMWCCFLQYCLSLKGISFVLCVGTMTKKEHILFSLSMYFWRINTRDNSVGIQRDGRRRA